MAKLTAKETQAGLFFIPDVTKPESLTFWRTAEKDVFGRVDRQLPTSFTGTIEVIRPVYKENGGNLIDFQLPNDPDSYTTHWITFRTATVFSSGTPAAKPVLSVTSSGPFGGFDIQVADQQMSEEKTSHGYFEFRIRIEFIGTFAGGKKITTKLINHIKTEPGFLQKLRDLLHDTLETRRPEIDRSVILATPTASITPMEPVRTWYANGAVDFVFTLSEPVRILQLYADRQAQYFVHSNKTSLKYLHA